MELRKKDAILVSFLLLPSTFIVMDIFVLIIVGERRQRCVQRYCTIGYISLADIVFLAMVNVILISIISGNKMDTSTRVWKIPLAIAEVASMSSLLTTLLLLLDRFAAIKYCFHYHSIVTRKQVLLSIFSAWVFSSVCVCLMKIKVSRTFLENRLYYAISITLFRAIIGIILLLLLFFTRKIRNLHVEAIEKRNSYLGIHKEKLDALNNLKKSIKETLKFNVATVVTSIIQSLIAILHSLSSHENVFMVSATLALFLFLKLSNLLSIILTHSKIRKEIKILCHCDSCLYTEN